MGTKRIFILSVYRRGWKSGVGKPDVKGGKKGEEGEDDKDEGGGRGKADN